MRWRSVPALKLLLSLRVATCFADVLLGPVNEMPYRGRSLRSAGDSGFPARAASGTQPGGANARKVAKFEPGVPFARERGFFFAKTAHLQHNC